MSAAKFSTYVLRMDAFVEMGDPKRMHPDDSRNFLVEAFPPLAAALAIGFDAADENIRGAFAFLWSELATLYDAALSGWMKNATLKLDYDGDPDGIEFAGGTLDLARVVSCQHLSREMHGGPQDHGFDLLADLLVSRLEAQSKDSKSSKVAA